MSSPIISIKNISKKYKLGATLGGRNYKTLRDVLTQVAFSPFRKLSAVFRKEPFIGGNHSSITNPITQLPNNTLTKSPNNPKEFWALKDISFDVQQGEVVGIIGANGAGKSTLLKILSEITEPTEGEIRIRGRVASLLEVGTGFHPELSGRENVYMNGAILGMTKAEIDAKFDKIVAFSGVEKFIDTPTKRYSSGMQVRLAFAVAAHLEPEILVVDEVLAVGDIAFQKKCLGKMEEVARGGRTVLFVSHNIGAIRSLCDRAIWLDNGQIVKNGATDEVVGDYEENQLKHFDESSYIVERKHEDVKNKNFYISRVEILDEKGENTNLFRYNEKLTLVLDFGGTLTGHNYNVIFHVYNGLGHFVCGGASAEYHGKYFKQEVRRVKIEIGPLILTSGKYRVILIARTEGLEDKWDNAIGFTVTECQPFATNWEMPMFRDGDCVIGHSFSAVEERGG